MASIKRVRLNFAKSMKLQAEKFIVFLNLEAKREATRTAKAAKFSGSWSAGSSSFGVSATTGYQSSVKTTYSGFSASYTATTAYKSSITTTTATKTTFGSTGFTGYSTAYAWKARLKEKEHAN